MWESSISKSESFARKFDAGWQTWSFSRGRAEALWVYAQEKFIVIYKSCNLTYMIPLPSIRINYICIISVMHYLIFIGVDPASTQKLEKLPLISIAQNQSCVHHNALKEHVNNLVEGALSLLWYINELLMFREAL